MENKKVNKVNYNSIYVPKQAPIAKRIGAFIVDLILVLVIATGLAWATSAIYGYDKYSNKIQESYITYGVLVEDEEKGKIEVNGNKYTYCNEIPSLTQEECNERYKACAKDKDFQEAFQKRNIGMVVIVTTAGFVSLLIYSFIIPLFLKHGRSLGSYLFGIGYVTEDDIEITPKHLLVRFLFGRFIIEVIIPFSGIMYILLQTGFGIVGIIIIAGVVLGNIYTLCFSQHKRGIHDIVAKVKPIDNTCQIYFKTVEELTSNRAREAQEMGGLKHIDS